MRKVLGMVVSVLAAGCWAMAAVPPPPQGADALPELRGEIAGRLRPMGGSLAATPLGNGAARLPVNFAGTTHERVSWDIPVALDASGSPGVRFDFYCEDISVGAGFCCYFRAKGGWYRAEFSPERNGQWETITINKSRTTSEESPAGWAHIDTIRVSVWRGGDTDTVCAIANIGLMGGGSPQALVVRADSRMSADDPESKSYASYAESVSATFEKLGIPSVQVADLDLTAAHLEGIRLAVLPYNPSLPAATAAALEAFVQGGGKLLACYSTSEEALRLLGLRRTGYVVAEAGAFKGFAKTAAGLHGQPDFAPQGSQRTMVAGAAEGMSARAIAVWRKADGTDSGTPAITLTPTGAFIGHVWFKPSSEQSVALMRAVTGELVPSFWEQAARETFGRIGKVAGAAGLAELQARLADAPAAAKAELARAQEGRAAAEAHIAKGEWQQSLAQSTAAAEAALRAWCRAQPARAGEFRAFWCHSALGLGDRDWDRAIRELKEAGFNAILPNMLWGGSAFYPSDVLPHHADLAKEGDQVAKCLAACRKYGVEMHVWKVNWNTFWCAPKSFLEMLAREGRYQVTYSGEKRGEWLCPSHPANQDLEVAAMLEVARKYPVDGIHFDYIRYPDDDTCYCDGCKERFQKRLGRPVADWAQTRRDQPLHDAWQDFRRASITAVVRRVHEGAKAIRPEVKISAAVFNNWPVNRDRIAQDWKMWCDNGWLDFICPMDYTESTMVFDGMVRQQKAQAGSVPLYPGIGLSCWGDPRDPVSLIEKISALRKRGAPGFTVFNYDAHAEAVLPYLRLGATELQMTR